ncbi:hypothetical protein, partial [Yinghuangia sp. YIM S10712]|uniref:hypothetical protein n=1 Tax=Yinghuangia sp. YIM S10712 TaxID=3436930 RepID=UPI003F53ADF7
MLVRVIQVDYGTSHLTLSSETYGSIRAGIAAWSAHLDELLGHYRAFGRCEGAAIGGWLGACPCPWCRVRDDVRAAIASVDNGDMTEVLDVLADAHGGTVTAKFEPPHGITTLHVVSVAAGER